jgi:hypothetical protein
MTRWDYMNLTKAILQRELDLICGSSVAWGEDNLMVEIRAELLYAISPASHQLLVALVIRDCDDHFLLLIVIPA